MNRNSCAETYFGWAYRTCTNRNLSRTHHQSSQQGILTLHILVVRHRIRLGILCLNCMKKNHRKRLRKRAIKQPHRENV